MINLVGRLFVLMVFVFSLGFLALAVGVYANHLNFKSKDPKGQPGIIDNLEQKIKEQAYARDRAKARYEAGYRELANVEQQRTDRLQRYAAKLEILRTGKGPDGNAVNNPVVVLKYGQDGLPIVAKFDGDPADAIQVRGQPLQPLIFYTQQLAGRHTDILDEQAKVDALQNELAALSLTMQGGRDANNKDIVGLIEQKAIQVDGKRRAIDEQERLKPYLANRFGEAVILQRREKALRERIEQLGKGESGRAVGQR
jgi:hypothetical protein